MNKTGLTNIGGFPATQQTLDFMQQATLAAMSAMAMLIGDKVILYGVQKQGSQLTNGWVSIGGELFEFVGGTALTTVDIVETPVSRQFGDLITKPVYFTRQVKCVAGGAYLLADFVRPGQIANMRFAGEIRAYGGATPPTGWLICDGSLLNIADEPALFKALGVNYGGDNITTFGLPDMRGKVPVGMDGTADFIGLGQTGGEKKHILIEGEMPTHKHPSGWGEHRTDAPFGVVAGPSNNLGSGGTDNDNYMWLTGPVGGGLAHNNLQPYQVVNYIISK